MNGYEVKPLVFISVDGGPDEAPKNEKTMISAIQNFTNHNMDALFVFTHAPGSIAYNKAERRMAPLSKFTAEIILPFDTFGSHLDSGNKTIDEELERQNFKAAGEVLADVWSASAIDEHPIIAHSIEPPNEERVRMTTSKSQKWISSHVRQYMLQIVKCGDIKCCTPFRTNYLTFFP